jgi:predicted RNA-binding protein with PIN domain
VGLVLDEVILVDGYNIINYWDELSKLKAESLAHARERLIDIMASFSSLKGIQVIIVFDGHLVKGGVRNSEFVSGVEVIYSGEGETADAVIEKLMHQLPPNIKRVYVATSDWDEQRIVLGKGAIRFSARELLLEVQRLHKKAKKLYANNNTHKQPLDSLINLNILEILEKWRRQ